MISNYDLKHWIWWNGNKITRFFKRLFSLTTQWGSIYEKNREKIEKYGYDEFISMPFDLTEKPVFGVEMLKAINEEEMCYRNTVRGYYF